MSVMSNAFKMQFKKDSRHLFFFADIGGNFATGD